MKDKSDGPREVQLLAIHCECGAGAAPIAGPAAAAAADAFELSTLTWYYN